MAIREVLEIRQGGGPRWLLGWLWVSQLIVILAVGFVLLLLALGLLTIWDWEIWATAAGVLMGSFEIRSRARSISRFQRVVRIDPTFGTVRCWATDKGEYLWDSTYEIRSFREVIVERCGLEEGKRPGTYVRLIGPGLALDLYEPGEFGPVLLNGRIQFLTLAGRQRRFASQVAELGHLAFRDESQSGQMAAHPASL